MKLTPRFVIVRFSPKGRRLSTNTVSSIDSSEETDYLLKDFRWVLCFLFPTIFETFFLWVVLDLLDWIEERRIFSKMLKLFFGVQWGWNALSISWLWVRKRYWAELLRLEWHSSALVQTGSRHRLVFFLISYWFFFYNSYYSWWYLIFSMSYCFSFYRFKIACRWMSEVLSGPRFSSSFLIGE